PWRRAYTRPAPRVLFPADETATPGARSPAERPYGTSGPRSTRFVDRLGAAKVREERGPHAGHQERADSAHHDRADRADGRLAEEHRRGARLEVSKLVGGADEDHVHAGDAPAHLVRRGELDDGLTDHDADHVGGAEHHERAEAEPEVG